MSAPPQDRRYTSSHEWALPEGDLVVIGITAHAVEELSDLVFINLPDDDAEARSGEPFGEIESVKAVSELNAPVSGKVVAVNRDVELDTVMESPYGDGWLIKIAPTDPSELESLHTAEQYSKLLDE